MSEINTGGPAFPQCSYNYKGGYDITGGMTLRDYFAAKAMQGLIGTAPSGTEFGVGCPENNLTYAYASYAMADAMLKAREG